MLAALDAAPCTFVITDAFDVAPPAPLSFKEVYAASAPPAAATAGAGAGAGAGGASSAPQLGSPTGASARAAGAAAAAAERYDPLPPEEDFELSDMKVVLSG